MASARIEQQRHHQQQQQQQQQRPSLFPSNSNSRPPTAAAALGQSDSSILAALETGLSLGGGGGGDPEYYVTLTLNPSVHMYNALKSRIESGTPQWIQRFVELNGLGNLLETLEQLSRAEAGDQGSFSGAILQLDCLSCVRALLNTTPGMMYFLQHQNYTRKLVLGEYNRSYSFPSGTKSCSQRRTISAYAGFPPIREFREKLSKSGKNWDHQLKKSVVCVKLSSIKWERCVWVCLCVPWFTNSNESIYPHPKVYKCSKSERSPFSDNTHIKTLAVLQWDRDINFKFHLVFFWMFVFAA